MTISLSVLSYLTKLLVRFSIIFSSTKYGVLKSISISLLLKLTSTTLCFLMAQKSISVRIWLLRDFCGLGNCLALTHGLCGERWMGVNFRWVCWGFVFLMDGRFQARGVGETDSLLVELWIMLFPHRGLGSICILDYCALITPYPYLYEEFKYFLVKNPVAC